MFPILNPNFARFLMESADIMNSLYGKGRVTGYQMTHGQSFGFITREIPITQNQSVPARRIKFHLYKKRDGSINMRIFNRCFFVCHVNRPHFHRNVMKGE